MNIKKKIGYHALILLKYFLRKKNYIISHEGTDKIFTNFYNDFRTKQQTSSPEIISLVFSKDRTMQLHAFLRSYFDNIDNFSSMVVLYKASNQEYRKSYQDLEEIFKEFPVTFIEEIDFRSQLINIVEKRYEEKIIFYVDDMIFTQKFDYNKLKSINPYLTIVALSRGLDMTYSIVLGKTLKLPKISKLNNELFEFSWNNIIEHSDWSYPVGVSGYMYATKEILSILNSIYFKAPNSLESAMQFFLPIYKTRFGICTKNAISVCIHANLTQVEGNNPVLGMFSIEKLLEEWNKGYQINYKEFYYKSMNISQEQHYTFSLRES